MATAGPLAVLTRRADFVAASHALRAGTPGFSLQARARGDSDPLRVGFTCSKKVGNAVARNRAKRRLRALAREVLAEGGRPGWDYVLVGRPGSTATLPFDRLRDDLRAALARIHRQPSAEAPPAARPARALPSKAVPLHAESAEASGGAIARPVRP